jgi:hypothetical protein
VSGAGGGRWSDGGVGFWEMGFRGNGDGERLKGSFKKNSVRAATEQSICTPFSHSGPLHVVM